MNVSCRIALTGAVVLISSCWFGMVGYDHLAVRGAWTGAGIIVFSVLTWIWIDSK